MGGGDLCIILKNCYLSLITKFILYWSLIIQGSAYNLDVVLILAHYSSRFFITMFITH